MTELGGGKTNQAVDYDQGQLKQDFAWGSVVEIKEPSHLESNFGGSL
jgi:hypothetical protein